MEEAGKEGPNSRKSQYFFHFSKAHRKQEVSLSVAQISCLERTVIESIVNPVQKTLYKLFFQSEQNSS